MTDNDLARAVERLTVWCNHDGLYTDERKLRADVDRVVNALAVAAVSCDAQAKRIAFLQDAAAKSHHEIEQVLGKVLGYPWYKDDQNIFPGATEADGVCTGEHVAESLADEAAKRIKELERERDEALLIAEGPSTLIEAGVRSPFCKKPD